MSTRYFNHRVQKARQFLAQRMSGDTPEHPGLTTSFWNLLEKIKQDREAALALAYSLLDTSAPSERFFAVVLLGKIFNPTERHQRAEARHMIAVLAARAARERHPAILTQIGYALGKPYLREAVRPLVKLSRHPHEDVRYAATGSIVSGIHERAPKYALDRLFELMRDPDPDVRNWATFAVGTQLDIEANNSDAIRQALLDRTRDRHFETRAEAFRGLARRGDRRGVLPLKHWLERQDQQGKTIWTWEIEAAGIYGDPIFYPALTSVAEWWRTDQPVMSWALARCHPDMEIRDRTLLEDQLY
ncbi:MAG TPA: HEAT repeat domain-containing protein [Candidatus Saccharimonadia bacterium]|nr:HEAT repeat domain-containing protein [Candidatus Saccharimonadia bacterium]